MNIGFAYIGSVRGLHLSFPLASPIFGCRFYRLVGSSGLEPPTSCLSGTRSNLLSYEPIVLLVVSPLAPFSYLSICGGDEGNRTPDPLLAGQVLSQLSYTPSFEGLFLFFVNP